MDGRCNLSTLNCKNMAAGGAEWGGGGSENLRHLGLVPGVSTPAITQASDAHRSPQIWAEALGLAGFSTGHSGPEGLVSAEPRSNEGDVLNCQCSPRGAGPSWSKQLWLHKAAAPKAELFSFSSSGTPGPGRGKGGIRSGTWFTFQMETLIESDLGLFISHYHPEPPSAFNVPGEPALSLQQGSGLTHSWPSDVCVMH